MQYHSDDAERLKAELRAALLFMQGRQDLKAWWASSEPITLPGGFLWFTGVGGVKGRGIRPLDLTAEPNVSKLSRAPQWRWPCMSGPRIMVGARPDRCGGLRTGRIPPPSSGAFL